MVTIMPDVEKVDVTRENDKIKIKFSEDYSHISVYLTSEQLSTLIADAQAEIVVKENIEK